MSDKYAGILERLEVAQEGSRDLDFAIGRALRGLPGDYHTWWTVSQHQTIQFNDGSMECADDFPHYTTSLDVALLLVPEGCGWQTGCGIDGTPSARVWGHDIHEDVEAANPAHALVIAALRARQATEDREGE
jgi:hypothetical protein